MSEFGKTNLIIAEELQPNMASIQELKTLINSNGIMESEKVCYVVCIADFDEVLHRSKICIDGIYTNKEEALKHCNERRSNEDNVRIFCQECQVSDKFIIPDEWIDNYDICREKEKDIIFYEHPY